MSKHHATNGFYSASPEGHIVFYSDGDETRGSVVVRAMDFPLDAEWVAIRMNDAFKNGCRAMKEEINRVLR